MSKLVIAEKPSVALALAKVLGAYQRQDGYMEGNGYLVSWCVGHLVGLAQPDAYDETYKKWSRESLPIIPENWKWEVADDKRTQFKVLKDLMFPLQRNFYNRYLRSTKERTVVIISDAMRYEVGRELFLRMQDDPKCMKESKLECMLGVLPSYTRLGMAALLPNKELSMTESYDVLVDGQPCQDLAQRQVILQNSDKDSCCIQFDELVAMKSVELKNYFVGKHLIYVYHNQIDARGDKVKTENEVFKACEEAICEIMTMIQRIANNGNTYKFIVTADHGFLYRRDRLNESDKISSLSDKQAFRSRRFVIANEALVDEGVVNVQLSKSIGGDDTRIISFPISNSVFKVSGGQNYVHGGSSPQELLIPVIDIKMDRGRMETTTVQIALVSMVQKITNLITNLEFIQSEPASDTVKATNYKLYFISEDNEKISNENTYVADKRDADPQKRIFRMRFTFKNKKYDKNKQYYLAVYDERVKSHGS